MCPHCSSLFRTIHLTYINLNYPKGYHKPFHSESMFFFRFCKPTEIPEDLKWKPFCVLEGVLEEEWDYFFNIIDCGPIKSCEPTMIGILPTIEKYLG